MAKIGYIRKVRDQKWVPYTTTYFPHRRPETGRISAGCTDFGHSPPIGYPISNAHPTKATAEPPNDSPHMRKGTQKTRPHHRGGHAEAGHTPRRSSLLSYSRTFLSCGHHQGANMYLTNEPIMTNDICHGRFQPPSDTVHARDTKFGIQGAEQRVCVHDTVVLRYTPVHTRFWPRTLWVYPFLAIPHLFTRTHTTREPEIARSESVGMARQDFRCRSCGGDRR